MSKKDMTWMIVKMMSMAVKIQLIVFTMDFQRNLLRNQTLNLPFKET